MSLGPDKKVYIFDLYATPGGTGAVSTATKVTSTGAGYVWTLPPGPKVIQVTMPATSTMTVKIQNSLDGNTWWDIASSTVSTGITSPGPILAEIPYTAIPKWRVQVSSFAALGTGSNTAQIACSLLGPAG